MRGNEIELFAEVRQRRLRIDSRDNAANAEEFGRAPEKRFVVWVEAESLVAEEPTEVEKIARAAAKIENIQWRAAVEPKILDALNIDTDPVVCVFVGVDLSRVGPVGIMLPQAF